MNSIHFEASSTYAHPINCAYQVSMGMTKIVPVQKQGLTNLVSTKSGVGDAVISFPNGYEIDGDLILTATWGDGFAVNRLEDNGTITEIFSTTTPMSPTTTSTYPHQIAIVKSAKKLILFGYSTYAYAIWDYSPCATGGVPIQLETGVNAFTTGVDINRVGQAYSSGMVSAGEWIYFGDYDATHYKLYPRRNLVTDVEELLDGTAIVDRSGYRYCLMYDEVNDRVFYFSYYNANFVVIQDASTATPIIRWCDVADTGQGDDAYDQGLFVPDPYSEPDIVYIGGSNRVLHLDITTCMAGTSTLPVVLGSYMLTTSFTDGQYFSNYFRLGCKYQTTDTNEPHNKLLTNPSNYLPVHSDRGYASMGGWIDMEHDKIVALTTTSSFVEDATTNTRGRNYRSDYGSPAVGMKSDNGTKYWVRFGYGQDGHSMKVWPYAIDIGIEGSWEIEFGSYVISSGVDTISIFGSDLFIPSGCTVTYFVSNDNGVIWYPYDYDARESLYIPTAGTEARFKIVATGFDYKSPYFSSYAPLGMVYGKRYSTENLPLDDIYTKVTSFKIGGAI